MYWPGRRSPERANRTSGGPMSELAAQPLFASATRAVRSLEDAGDPLPADVLSRLHGLESRSSGDAERCRELEHLLRPFVLVEAHIDGQGMTICTPGEAPPRLVQHGWRSFLVRVVNPHQLEGDLFAMAKGVFG